MKYFISNSLLIAIAFLCSAQYGEHSTESSSNFFIIDGMKVEWEFAETSNATDPQSLTFKLHSPYKGWVAIGFNTTNDIVNANLLMGAVEENSTEAEEFFVVNFADQRSLESLGGQNSVTDFNGTEDQSGTTFEFTIDPTLNDDFHYPLQEGQKIWLICAYSMADDFGHHSIMRRHVEVSL